MARTTSFKKEKTDKYNLKVKRQKAKVQVKSQKSDRIFSNLIIVGSILLILGFSIFILTFLPIFKEEAKYALGSTGFARKTPTSIKPVDTNFGIVIPKIMANARVIDNVDPFNSREYQWALTKGVAHARGTAYPGRAGNIFIFAHSSSNWFTANQYNSVFYLVNKLEKGDKIEIYYKNKKYIYQVTEKKIVDAGDVEYLNPWVADTSILTLMTCWPAGTSLKRLIVQAEIRPLDK